LNQHIKLGNFGEEKLAKEKGRKSQESFQKNLKNKLEKLICAEK